MGRESEIEREREQRYTLLYDTHQNNYYALANLGAKSFTHFFTGINDEQQEHVISNFMGVLYLLCKIIEVCV